MTQSTARWLTIPACLVGTAILVVCALPASAQTDQMKPLVLGPPPKPAHATSSLDATAPPPTEQRENRALAAAIFAQPAAATRAADKAAPVPVTVAPVAPKEEWSVKGVRPGGDGLLFKTPF